MEPLTFDYIEAAVKKITYEFKPRPHVIVNPFLDDSRIVIKSGEKYYVCKDFNVAQVEKIIDIGEPLALDGGLIMDHSYPKYPSAYFISKGIQIMR